MQNFFMLSDDQIKGCVSRAITKLASQLQEDRGGAIVWDKDVIQFIKDNTGVEFPISTYRSYRNGDRQRLAALDVIAEAFNVPLAYFMGPDRLEMDRKRWVAYLECELENSSVYEDSFALPFFDNPKVTRAAIPQAQATRLGLKPGKARVIEVTRDNNGSNVLSIGSLAIVDISYSSIGMSGDYLINNDGTPMIVNVKAGFGKSVKVQILDNVIDQYTSDLDVLGRVVGSIG